MPPAEGGKPKRPASHRTSWSSTSVAAGDSIQPPLFGLSPEASRSAMAPGTVPPPLM